MKPDYKLVAKSKYIHLTAELADEIWRECYKRYYTPKQLDAILDELQSPEAIEEQIDDGVNYFIVQLGSQTVGYFAWKMENTSLHLMHIYFKPEFRGKALGRDIINYCERLARSDGKGRVWCTVHSRSLPVQQFFKARGYRTLRPAENVAGGVPLDEIEMEHTLR
jgi:ribosomal protein S18 acetylase RimI-like enzyme